MNVSGVVVHEEAGAEIASGMNEIVVFVRQ